MTGEVEQLGLDPDTTTYLVLVGGDLGVGGQVALLHGLVVTALVDRVGLDVVVHTRDEEEVLQLAIDHDPKHIHNRSRGRRRRSRSGTRGRCGGRCRCSRSSPC